MCYFNLGAEVSNLIYLTRLFGMLPSCTVTVVCEQTVELPKDTLAKRCS